MTIGEILKNNNPKVHSKLRQIKKSRNQSKKKIKLGDSPKNLMRTDSHKRVNGALRQKTWSK